MTLNFQHQLNTELLRSERRRIISIIGIFLFAMGFRVADSYLFKVDAATAQIHSLAIVLLFPVIIIIFEIFCLLYINRKLKSGSKKIPMVMQYVITTVEILLPSLIIISVVRQYPQFDMLRSPALYIYFIFIILSTLRLNFPLSFFCGLLSAAAYATITLLMDGQFTSHDAGRVIIMLLSGVAAGLVANQIRNGINNSVKEAERRQRVENLFGRQLSAEVAEKMLENDGIIESKRMNVAILFIDIRNFTRFAAGRKPEEIVQYQNEFFKIVINVIARYHGVVHQFLGDGCMVTFGAPIHLENPSQNAVEAGLALASAIDIASLRSEIPATRIGLGIHTGEVVTGNIGTHERQQYSITGSVVILASRIEQLNKEFGSQLLVSEDVARAIRPGTANTTCLDAVNLKGWHEPMPIYKLL